jgi:hypothetical protein
MVMITAKKKRTGAVADAHGSSLNLEDLNGRNFA